MAFDYLPVWLASTLGIAGLIELAFIAQLALLSCLFFYLSRRLIKAAQAPS